MLQCFPSRDSSCRIQAHHVANQVCELRILDIRPREKRWIIKVLNVTVFPECCQRLAVNGIVANVFDQTIDTVPIAEVADLSL